MYAIPRTGSGNVVGAKVIVGQLNTVPVPISEAIAGEFVALLVMINCAERSKVADALNCIPMKQFCPGRIGEFVHPSDVIEKSPGFTPPMVTDPLVITRLALPEFNTVNVRVLATPTTLEPKSSGFGINVTTGWLPELLIGTSLVPLPALLRIRNVALNKPLSCGAAMTPIVQVLFGAIGIPVQVSFVLMKSLALGPVSDTLLMMSAEPPELLIVTCCTALVVPTNWSTNIRLIGLTPIDGTFVPPTPLRSTCCGELVALDVTSS